ncbi:MAG: hypothetical protein U1E70_20085 [Acetobacteraceae bacterium]
MTATSETTVAPPETGASATTSTNNVALLALAFAAAVTASVSLVTINRVKDAVIDASLRGRPIGAGTLLSTIGVSDIVLAAVAGLSVLLLVWLEVTRRSFSRLLATATTGQALILLLILTAWFGHGYLNPGVLLGGDIGAHIARVLEVRRGLQDGTLPFWTNYQYAGAPLLWFTGPLLYVVGGGLDIALRDAVLTSKLLLFALHLLSGVLFFAWMRRLSIMPVAAMLAAAVFAGSFAHLHLFLFRGVMPQAFTIVFTVLVFYAADGLCRDQGRRWANVLIFALATAGLVINHQPHALFAAAYLAVFGAVALLTGFWRWRGLPWLVMAGVTGGVASAIAVLPVIAEADWVMIEPDGGFFRLQLPSMTRLLHLVMWRNVRTTWGPDVWAYLGLGAAVFGVAGVAGLATFRLRRGTRGAAMPAAACLALSFFLWNPVVRDIIFLLFFLALIGALGLDWLISSHRLTGRALLVVALLAIADLASTSVQPVARIDKGFMISAGRYLEQTAPDQRMLALTLLQDGSLEADAGPAGGALNYEALVQRIGGNHNLAATRVHNFLMSAALQSEFDLTRSGRLTPDTAAALGLFNVARVICFSSIAVGCPATIQDTQENAALGRFLALPASPVLFSRTLTEFRPDPKLAKPMLWSEDYRGGRGGPHVAALDGALREVLRIEAPDFTARTASALAVQGPLPRVTAADSAWHPVLRSYAVGLDTVRAEVETDGPGYVQLAHPWFPSMRVTINGQAVQPIRGSIDLLVVPLPAGQSVIVLHDGWTAMRLASAGISAVGLLLILGVTVAAGRSRTMGPAV